MYSSFKTSPTPTLNITVKKKFKNKFYKRKKKNIIVFNHGKDKIFGFSLD